MKFVQYTLIIYLFLIYEDVMFANAEPIMNENLIQNIEEASINEFPFIVSIGRKGSSSETYTLRQGHFCGGALISQQHVLTAAHCLVGEKPNNVRVTVGIVRFTSGGISYDVLKWNTYPQWNKKKDFSQDHDTAVIKLQTPMDNSIARPISIYMNYLDNANVELKSAGWGKTVNVITSPVLLKIPLKIVPLKKCETDLENESGQPYYINMQHMCTRSTKGLYLASGDSGGPVIYTKDGVDYVVGVNEAYCDKSCTRINTHNRVYYYKDFITAMLHEN